MKSLIKKALASFDIELRRSSLGKMHYATDFLDLLRNPNESPELAAFLSYAATNAHRSHAQLFQDLFVLETVKEKRDGFFVEFGATNGVDLSNTALLERDYGWKGILAEP